MRFPIRTSAWGDGVAGVHVGLAHRLVKEANEELVPSTLEAALSGTGRASLEKSHKLYGKNPQ